MIIFLIFLNLFWFGFFLATTPFPMMGNSSMLFTFLLSLDWRLVVWWCGGHFFLLLWFYYACLAAHDFFSIPSWILVLWVTTTFSISFVVVSVAA